MLKDLRHAIRMLWQAKGWTTVVVLSLALGIGANTALFSAMNGMLLTKVPVKDPDTLVRFLFWGRNDMSNSSSGYGYSNKTPDGQDVRASFSYPMYKQFVADNRTMTDLFACAPQGRMNVVVDGQADLSTAFLCVRQLLPGSRRVSAPGPHDRSRRRYAVGDACGGHQLEILALAIRHRSRRPR